MMLMVSSEVDEKGRTIDRRMDNNLLLKSCAIVILKLFDQMKLQSDHPHILSNVVHDKNRAIVFGEGFLKYFGNVTTKRM